MLNFVFKITKWIRLFGMIFDGLFLILFANNKKHPGEIFSFLISQINFEKNEIFRYPKSRCNKIKD